MKDDKSLQTHNSSNSVPPSSPYQLLKGQRDKMGTVATKTIAELKDFLNQEIPLPPAADHFFDNVKAKLTGEKDAKLQQIAQLKEAVRKSHEVLAGAQTITLFPDEIIVDRTKITIIKRYSFWSTDVISIQIEDVLNVSTSIGILFGSLTIASRVMNTTDHFDIHLLWRKDAIDLKHVIQGYVIAKHSGIDTSVLPRDEMLETLRELGHDSGI